jgi:hypothetical protein
MMEHNSKPKGPASYFPSIEKTYGQPMAYCQSTAWGTELPMQWLLFVLPKIQNEH